MSLRRLAEKQPERFAFSEANRVWAEKTIARYPEGRQASAVISLLWRAQEQEGWVTEPAIETIAAMLSMPKIRVLEVATFYTMFHLEPVGSVAHLQVCGTTPCWLRGANDLKEVCRKKINHEQFHLSADGAFSWEEVECLGACVNAPLIQINADTYEDLTAASLAGIIDDLAAGRPVKPGPQIDRAFSAPAGRPTTLMEVGAEPEPKGGAGAPDPQTPINAAKPEAATQTPVDPTGAVSQAVEKAEDSLTTKEKREEKIAETERHKAAVEDGKKD
jgi:NADH-quinone oxidoreductase subunit E